MGKESLGVRERPGLTLSNLRRLKGKGGAGVIRRLAWCQTWVQISKGLCSLICSLFPALALPEVDEIVQKSAQKVSGLRIARVCSKWDTSANYWDTYRQSCNNSILILFLTFGVGFRRQGFPVELRLASNSTVFLPQPKYRDCSYTPHVKPQNFFISF